MLKLAILIYFFGYNSLSDDYCLLDNIFEKNEKIVDCDDKKLLFGYYEFKSKNNNLKFSFNKELNEYMPENYKTEILTFTRNNCYKKSLKIKTITNFNNNLNEYINKIIIKCRFKS